MQYEYTIGQLYHRSLRFLSVLIKNTMTKQYLRQAPALLLSKGVGGGGGAFEFQPSFSERMAEYMDGKG